MDALQVQRDMTQNGEKAFVSRCESPESPDIYENIVQNKTEELETENARSAAPRLNREHQDERHSQADG